MNPERITRMASAFYESCILFVATGAGVFEALAKMGAAPVGRVAEACGLDPRGARLLLDACVAVELLHKAGELYRNSLEAAAFLVPGARGDLTGAIRYNRDVYGAWGRLAQFARTGRPVEAPQLHLGADDARTRAFVMSMHGRALGIGQAVVPSLDLGGVRRLLDVGGGPGTFSALIARAHPGMTCSVIDLPPIVAIAEELLEQQGVGDRVQMIPGSYHEVEFPGDQDAVLFSGVLHQESAEAIQRLMHRAYAALAPGGRVFVVDMMTDATHTAPAFSALFAVNMALTTDAGWVFSDSELSGWVSAAGFREFSCRALPPPMPHWVATARK